MDRAAKERAAKERAAVELLGERDPRFKQKADESEEDWLTRGRIAVQLSRKSRIVANSPPEAGEQNVGLRPSVGIRRITTKEGPNPNDGRADAAPAGRMDTTAAEPVANSPPEAGEQNVGLRPSVGIRGPNPNDSRADAAPAGRMDTTAAEPVAPPPSYDHNHDVIFTARLKETVSSLPGKTTALFGEFRNELSKHIGAIITYFVTSSEFNASIGPSSGYIILYDESRKVLIYNKNNDIARRFRSYLKNIAPDMGDRIVNILFENYSDEPISSEGLHSAILKVLIDNNNNDPDILERLFTQIDDFRTSIMPDINERERLVQQINAYIQNLRSTGAALDELAKKAAQPPIVQRNARGFRVTQKQQVTVNSSKQVVVPVPKRSWLNWMRGKPRPTQGGGTRRLTRKAGARATKSHLRATRSRRRSSGGRARTRRHG